MKTQRDPGRRTFLWARREGKRCDAENVGPELFVLPARHDAAQSGGTAGIEAVRRPVHLGGITFEISHRHRTPPGMAVTDAAVRFRASGRVGVVSSWGRRCDQLSRAQTAPTSSSTARVRFIGAVLTASISKATRILLEVLPEGISGYTPRRRSAEHTSETAASFRISAGSDSRCRAEAGFQPRTSAQSLTSERSGWTESSRGPRGSSRSS